MKFVKVTRIALVAASALVMGINQQAAAQHPPLEIDQSASHDLKILHRIGPGTEAANWVGPYERPSIGQNSSQSTSNSLPQLTGILYESVINRAGFISDLGRNFLHNIDTGTGGAITALSQMENSLSTLTWSPGAEIPSTDFTVTKAGVKLGPLSKIHKKLKVEGEFTIEDTGTGIELTRQETGLRVGTGLTLKPHRPLGPVGSRWEIEGFLKSGMLTVTIKETYADFSELELKLSGVALLGTSIPMDTMFRIGDDSGTSRVWLGVDLNF